MNKLISMVLLVLVLVGSEAFVAQADGLSVSQSNVYLNVGQNITINVYPPNNQLVNVTSITNSYVAYANVSNNVVTVYGLSAGSTQIVLSTYDNYSATIYVTVGSGGGSVGGISFSQSYVNLNVGQNQSVTIYSGVYNNTYYISSNPNNNVVSASISGNNLNLYGLTNGSSTITVSSYGGQMSGSVTVNVSGFGGSLNLSQTNVNLNTGQSTTVTAYNAFQSLTIASNSNSYATSVSVVNDRLTIYANNPGSSTIVVSDQGGRQATIYVSVSGSGYNNNVYLFNTNLAQAVVGRYYTHQLQASGGTTPYTYNLSTGSLPSGMFLSSSGLIYGTPSYIGSYSFTVWIRDYYSNTSTSNTLYLNVASGGSVSGVNVYANGTLINESGTIYTTYKNTKSGFANMSAFLNLGYKLSNVEYGSVFQLSNTGYVISSSNVAHPWGTWIKSGQTVYFVHENGLIPIASYDVFINNGGQERLLVPANMNDFNKQILELMVTNDYRLK